MIVPNYLSADEMRLKTAKTTRRERRGTNGKMIKRGTLAAFIVVVLAAGCFASTGQAAKTPTSLLATTEPKANPKSSPSLSMTWVMVRWALFPKSMPLEWN